MILPIGEKSDHFEALDKKSSALLPSSHHTLKTETSQEKSIRKPDLNSLNATLTHLLMFVKRETPRDFTKRQERVLSRTSLVSLTHMKPQRTQNLTLILVILTLTLARLLFSITCFKRKSFLTNLSQESLSL